MMNVGISSLISTLIFPLITHARIWAIGAEINWSCLIAVTNCSFTLLLLLVMCQKPLSPWPSSCFLVFCLVLAPTAFFWQRKWQNLVVCVWRKADVFIFSIPLLTKNHAEFVSTVKKDLTCGCLSPWIVSYLISWWTSLAGLSGVGWQGNFRKYRPTI